MANDIALAQVKICGPFKFCSGPHVFLFRPLSSLVLLWYHFFNFNMISIWYLQNIMISISILS